MHTPISTLVRVVLILLSRVLFVSILASSSIVSLHRNTAL